MVRNLPVRCLILAVVLMSAAAGRAPAGTADLGEMIKYHYRDRTPGALAAVLDHLDDADFRGARNAWPPMIGFLAGLTVRDPDSVQRALDGRKLSPLGSSIVARALWYGGRPDLAGVVAETADWNRRQIDDLQSHPPNLLHLPVQHPDALDTLWGAFSATGDLAYVRRIANHLADILARGDIVSGDLFRMATLVASGRTAQASDLIRSYAEKSDDALATLMTGSAALWALGSNGKQHPPIGGLIHRLWREDPDAADRKMMKRMAYRAIHRADTISHFDHLRPRLLVVAADRAAAVEALVDDIRLFEDLITPTGPVRVDFPRGRDIHLGVFMYLEAGEASTVAVSLVSEDGQHDALVRLATEPAPKAAVTGGRVTVPAARIGTLGEYRLRFEVIRDGRVVGFGDKPILVY